MACAAAGLHPELVAGVAPLAGAYEFGRGMRASQPMRSLWLGGLGIWRALVGTGLVPRRLLVPSRLLGIAGGVLSWAGAQLTPSSCQVGLPRSFASAEDAGCEQVDPLKKLEATLEKEFVSRKLILLRARREGVENQEQLQQGAQARAMQ